MKQVSIRFLFVLTVMGMGMGACTKQQMLKGGESWRDSICREETRDRGPCPDDEDEARWRRL